MYFVIAHKFIGSASDASGSSMTEIFILVTLITVSLLHFGQNKGKFLITVSIVILVLVLFLQTGHIIQSDFSLKIATSLPYPIHRIKNPDASI